MSIMWCDKQRCCHWFMVILLPVHWISLKSVWVDVTLIASHSTEPCLSSVYHWSLLLSLTKPFCFIPWDVWDRLGGSSCSSAVCRHWEDLREHNSLPSAAECNVAAEPGMNSSGEGRTGASPAAASCGVRQSPSFVTGSRVLLVRGESRAFNGLMDLRHRSSHAGFLNTEQSYFFPSNDTATGFPPSVPQYCQPGMG